MQPTVGYVPSDDDEHVETVPGLSQVGVSADQPHCHHFDAHLEREEGKDEVVEDLKDLTSCRQADTVAARLVHSQSQAVEQYYAHAYPFKPTEERC